ncbi:Polyamine transporter 1 [Yarrowia sp. C11]|nr:Polyamine transporter 1 [Yarrowia sp. C11]KAG5364774.1 Polyamine transporter 1 [Yarrowia sp. E02]
MDLEKQHYDESSGQSEANDIMNDNSGDEQKQAEPVVFHRDEHDAVASLGPVETRGSGMSQEEALSQILSHPRHRATNTPMPPMGNGKEYPPLLPPREAYLVGFEGPDDPLHPFNWPMRKKLMISCVLGFATFVVTWGSAVFAPASPHIAKQFGVIQEVTTLGISLYVFGFATGPIVWAPLSELFGRKLPICISGFMIMCFTFGVAAAKDLQTIMLCRFFASCTGSAPLVVVAAAFADIFNNSQRGIAVLMFASVVFIGPIIAPVVGGFISESYLGWRWTMYITGIMSALSAVLAIVFYQESYHPMLLTSRAKELRERTGNWGIYASQEVVELDLHAIISQNLVRPIKMLFTEPILLLITIYTSFIYGILYLFLEAYPIVFIEGYKMSPTVGELPYLGVLVGFIFSCVFGCFIFEPRYVAAVQRNNGKPVPEARLIFMMSGAITFPIGIFWFTWSGNYHEHVHWAVPTVSGIFSGYGLMSIFVAALNYVVDSYLIVAASALAANTFMRSIFAGAFPLFAGYMFHAMHVNWAGLLIGLVACALAPVPFLFYIYGQRIRRSSKYAFDLS